MKIKLSDFKIPPIAKEGHVFILIAVVLAFFLFLVSIVLGLIGILPVIFCIYFFRDPQRNTIVDDNLVIAPADGKIIKIEKTRLPQELDINDDTEYQKISIFMNVFNVHVNRMPISGTISQSAYFPGEFFNASLDKASLENERNAFIIENNKEKIVCIQIAGLIARRIVTYAMEGDALKAGDKIGLIRFGSRVDIYLPPSFNLLVSLNQTTIAGETLLAHRSLKLNCENVNQQ